MKRLAFSLFLLSAAVLCHGSESSHVLELPRKDVAAEAFKTEEMDFAGQKRPRILTPNYDIIAYRPHDGILAGERLEHLLNVWEWLFAEFVGKTENKQEQRRHRVILYRDEQEYGRYLARIDPAASRAKTNGYYSTPRKTAHFFSPESKVLPHEGTHQILIERFFPDHEPTFRNNFWVVEGIALFMETLNVGEKDYKIGNLLDNRLFAAKEYHFKHGYKMPIRQLTAMSAAEIHLSEEMIRIYSQSAALVHWLMFAEEGRYRKPLFELLRRTYLDEARPATLSELTGLSYEELDKKYAEFLMTIPE